MGGNTCDGSSVSLGTLTNGVLSDLRNQQCINPKDQGATPWFYAKRKGIWVSVLWKVLGCFAHDAKYWDDSWKKKKDCHTSAHFVYMMPNTEIFGNIEMCDIAVTNFLDEPLCEGCFFCFLFFSIPYFGAA